MIDMEMQSRWRSGEAIPGVAFGPRAHVRILEGPFTDECGSIRALMDTDPEPCYHVEVDAAHVELNLPQSALGRD